MIDTLDKALAGMKQPVDFAKSATGTMVSGRPHSLLYLPGIPGAAVVPAIGLSGEPLMSYPGGLPFLNPVSGNTYLARLQAQASQSGTLMLCDRLWHNSGIDVTSLAEQIFTDSALIPPRDANGLQIGDGVFAAVEVTSLLGSGTPTLTLKYVNTQGVQGIGNNIVAVPTASIAGTFYMIGLATGDDGVQRALSLTLSATATSGAMSVVLYRVLARLELTGANIPNAIDALTGGFPRMYDNTVPFLVFIPTTTTSSSVVGHMIYTQG